MEALAELAGLPCAAHRGCLFVARGSTVVEVGLGDGLLVSRCESGLAAPIARVLVSASRTGEELLLLISITNELEIWDLEPASTRPLLLRRGLQLGGFGLPAGASAATHAPLAVAAASIGHDNCVLFYSRSPLCSGLPSPLALAAAGAVEAVDLSALAASGSASTSAGEGLTPVVPSAVLQPKHIGPSHGPAVLKAGGLPVLVSSLAVHPSRPLVAAGAGDGSVTVFDASALLKARNPEELVSSGSLPLIDDAPVVFVGSTDPSIAAGQGGRLAGRNSEAHRTPPLPPGIGAWLPYPSIAAITALDFHPTLPLLAAADASGRLVVWALDAEGRGEAASTSGVAGGAVLAARLAPGAGPAPPRSTAAGSFPRIVTSLLFDPRAPVVTAASWCPPPYVADTAALLLTRFTYAHAALPPLPPPAAVATAVKALAPHRLMPRQSAPSASSPTTVADVSALAPGTFASTVGVATGGGPAAPRLLRGATDGGQLLWYNHTLYSLLEGPSAAASSASPEGDEGVTGAAITASWGWGAPVWAALAVAGGAPDPALYCSPEGRAGGSGTPFPPALCPPGSSGSLAPLTGSGGAVVETRDAGWDAFVSGGEGDGLDAPLGQADAPGGSSSGGSGSADPFGGSLEALAAALGGGGGKAGGAASSSGAGAASDSKQQQSQPEIAAYYTERDRVLGRTRSCGHHGSGGASPASSASTAVVAPPCSEAVVLFVQPVDELACPPPSAGGGAAFARRYALVAAGAGGAPLCAAAAAAAAGSNNNGSGSACDSSSALVSAVSSPEAALSAATKAGMWSRRRRMLGWLPDGAGGEAGPLVPTAVTRSPCGRYALVTYTTLSGVPLGGSGGESNAAAAHCLAGPLWPASQQEAGTSGASAAGACPAEALLFGSAPVPVSPLFLAASVAFVPGSAAFVVVAPGGGEAALLPLPASGGSGDAPLSAVSAPPGVTVASVAATPFVDPTSSVAPSTSPVLLYAIREGSPLEASGAVTLAPAAASLASPRGRVHAKALPRGDAVTLCYSRNASGTAAGGGATASWGPPPLPPPPAAAALASPSAGSLFSPTGSVFSSASAPGSSSAAVSGPSFTLEPGETVLRVAWQPVRRGAGATAPALARATLLGAATGHAIPAPCSPLLAVLTPRRLLVLTPDLVPCVSLPALLCRAALGATGIDGSPAPTGVFGLQAGQPSSPCATGACSCWDRSPLSSFLWAGDALLVCNAAGEVGYLTPWRGLLRPLAAPAVVVGSTEQLLSAPRVLVSAASDRLLLASPGPAGCPLRFTVLSYDLLEPLVAAAVDKAAGIAAAWASAAVMVAASSGAALPAALAACFGNGKSGSSSSASSSGGGAAVVVSFLVHRAASARAAAAALKRAAAVRPRRGSDSDASDGDNDDNDEDEAAFSSASPAASDAPLSAATFVSFKDTTPLALAAAAALASLVEAYTHVRDAVARYACAGTHPPPALVAAAGPAGTKAAAAWRSPVSASPTTVATLASAGLGRLALLAATGGGTVPASALAAAALRLAPLSGCHGTGAGLTLGDDGLVPQAAATGVAAAAATPFAAVNSGLVLAAVLRGATATRAVPAGGLPPAAAATAPVLWCPLATLANDAGATAPPATLSRIAGGWVVATHASGPPSVPPAVWRAALATGSPALWWAVVAPLSGTPLLWPLALANDLPAAVGLRPPLPAKLVLEGDGGGEDGDGEEGDDAAGDDAGALGGEAAAAADPWTAALRFASGGARLKPLPRGTEDAVVGYWRFEASPEEEVAVGEAKKKAGGGAVALAVTPPASTGSAATPPEPVFPWCEGLVDLARNGAAGRAAGAAGVSSVTALPPAPDGRRLTALLFDAFQLYARAQGPAQAGAVLAAQPRLPAATPSGAPLAYPASTGLAAFTRAAISQEYDAPVEAGDASKTRPPRALALGLGFAAAVGQPPEATPAAAAAAGASPPAALAAALAPPLPTGALASIPLGTVISKAGRGDAVPSVTVTPWLHQLSRLASWALAVPIPRFSYLDATGLRPADPVLGAFTVEAWVKVGWPYAAPLPRAGGEEDDEDGGHGHGHDDDEGHAAAAGVGSQQQQVLLSKPMTLFRRIERRYEPSAGGLRFEEGWALAVRPDGALVFSGLQAAAGAGSSSAQQQLQQPTVASKPGVLRLGAWAHVAVVVDASAAASETGSVLARLRRGGAPPRSGALPSSGLPPAKVRVYTDGRLVAEGTVSTSSPLPLLDAAGPTAAGAAGADAAVAPPAAAGLRAVLLADDTARAAAAGTSDALLVCPDAVARVSELRVWARPRSGEDLRDASGFHLDLAEVKRLKMSVVIRAKGTVAPVAVPAPVPAPATVAAPVPTGLELPAPVAGGGPSSALARRRAAAAASAGAGAAAQSAAPLAPGVAPPSVPTTSAATSVPSTSDFEPTFDEPSGGSAAAAPAPSVADAVTAAAFEATPAPAPAPAPTSAISGGGGGGGSALGALSRPPPGVGAGRKAALVRAAAAAATGGTAAAPPPAPEA